MSSFQIVFYCEFGPKYGFGHLMRSIALAQTFFEYDKVKTCCFSTSSADGFNELFNSVNMLYVQLPKNAMGLSFKPDNHFNLSDELITIFDNYNVTREQMINYKQNYPNLVAIDDLADRIFNVDIIINQNLGSNQLEYKTLNQPKLFLGTQYALLRKNILTSKRKKEKYRIFMSFGGGEVYDRIKGLLEILSTFNKDLKNNITIDFVFSGNRNNKEQIGKFFHKSERLQFNFIENQMDLSTYMERADFAITAAGSTVFELAFLGVPQIVFVIDKNQENTGNMINEVGIGQCLGDIKNLKNVNFNKILFSFLYDDIMKHNMSKQAQTLIDGKGAKRVVDGILNYYG